jgi:hypothetical protein
MELMTGLAGRSQGVDIRCHISFAPCRRPVHVAKPNVVAAFLMSEATAARRETYPA